MHCRSKILYHRQDHRSTWQVVLLESRSTWQELLGESRSTWQIVKSWFFYSPYSSPQLILFNFSLFSCEAKLLWFLSRFVGSIRLGILENCKPPVGHNQMIWIASFKQYLTSNGKHEVFLNTHDDNSTKAISWESSKIYLVRECEEKSVVKAI